jgi:uncharacterized protein
MTAITLLTQATYRAMPWRNGLGTTMEIALEAGPGDRFRWRLSIADVARSGPFSRFEGYDRVIAVVAGAGMRLAVEGRPIVLIDRESAPHAFPGDAATDCTLIEGAIRDFNLIVDRASTRGSVVGIRLTDKPRPTDLDGAVTLLHALEGGILVDTREDGSWLVPEGNTLRIDDISERVTLTGLGTAHALLATVRRR